MAKQFKTQPTRQPIRRQPTLRSNNFWRVWDEAGECLQDMGRIAQDLV